MAQILHDSIDVAGLPEKVYPGVLPPLGSLFALILSAYYRWPVDAEVCLTGT
jgi:hypothetical protein